MIMIITAIYVAATAAVAPFFLYILMVTLAAMWPSRWPRKGVGSGSGSTGPRFLIIIPAHDEEGGIASTVASCLAADYPRDRFSVAVIADNCTDGTADSARSAGAFVVERHDPDHKSKGHALEFFFDTVPEGNINNYDAAVIVDADTVIDPALLARFAEALGSGADWVQGYYTVRNPDASWRTRLMTYAFSLYNGVWPLGQDHLGLSVGLKGNGMCFSSAGLRRFPWRAYGLVEDAEFGLMLRASGERVRFLPSARVYGEMVTRPDAAASQRKRWEAGRRSLRSRFFPLLRKSQSIGLFRKSMYLVELGFPPLVTLALALVLISSIHPLAIGLKNCVPLSMMLRTWDVAFGLTLVVYALSPVVAMRLPPRYLGSLAALPYYAAWKLLTAAGRGPTNWVRTRREG